MCRYIRNESKVYVKAFSNYVFFLRWKGIEDDVTMATTVWLHLTFQPNSKPTAMKGLYSLYECATEPVKMQGFLIRDDLAGGQPFSINFTLKRAMSFQ